MNLKNSADVELEPRLVLRLAMGLALFLFVVVLGLNWLTQTRTPISSEQFEQLVREGAITQIEIFPGQGWSGLITDSKTVWVEAASPTSEQVSRWRSQRLLLDGGEADYGGLMVLFLGLAGGGAYLVLQGRSYRRQGSSPRQQLQDLEDARSRGDIDEEQFQKKSEAVWGAM
jgi:hypothetical protein